MSPDSKLRLLLFNLATDADDPALGFTTAWINALATRCAYIHVITMRAGRLAVADNVRVYSVGKEKAYSEARRVLEFYRILFGLLRRNRYDACFAHMMEVFAVIGAPVLKLWRIPITLWYTHSAVTPKLRLAEKLVDQVVTSSAHGFRIPSRKVQIIGHGIDTDVFVPATTIVSGRPFTILSVGRLAPVKRLELLIEAVRVLVRDYGLTNIRLRIVGEAESQDAPYAAGLRGRGERYGLGDTVEFAGAVSHERVVREYQNADVMVNVSNTRSLDKAALEAMACGLPVVTTNEAFAPLLQPWADWLLVPLEAPETLPVFLRRLVDLPVHERRALGLSLREVVVREHSLEQLVTRLMSILPAKAAE